MDPRMGLAVFCTEMYRSGHGLTGDQVMDLFEANRVLDWIDDRFEELSGMDAEHLMERLDRLMAEGGYRG